MPESSNLVTDLMMVLKNMQKSYFQKEKFRPGDSLTMVLPNIQNKQKSYFQAEKLKPGDRPNDGITKYTK